MRNYTRLVPQPKELRTLRDVLREHLNHARVTQADLAVIWGMHEASTRRLLSPHKDRPNSIRPHMIDAVIKALKLDFEDAQELHWLGALEMGFRIGKLTASA